MRFIAVFISPLGICRDFIRFDRQQLWISIDFWRILSRVSEPFWGIQRFQLRTQDLPGNQCLEHHPRLRWLYSLIHPESQQYWYPHLPCGQCHSQELQGDRIDEGISAYNSTNSNISSNHVYDNTPTGVGIYIDPNSNGSYIFNNSAHTTGGGFNVNSHHNTLLSNTAYNFSGGTTSIAFRIAGNENNLIGNTANYTETALSRGFNVIGNDNNLTDNTAACVLNDRTSGFYISGDNNRIEGNTIQNNTNGIYLSGADNNFISENELVNDYGYGIRIISGSDNNNIISNGVSPFGTPTSGIGISVTDSENNTITRNNVSTDGVGLANYGIELVENRKSNVSLNKVNTGGANSSRDNYGIYLHSGTASADPLKLNPRKQHHHLRH